MDSRVHYPKALLDTVHGLREVLVLRRVNANTFVVTDPFFPGVAVYADADELQPLAEGLPRIWENSHA